MLPGSGRGFEFDALKIFWGIEYHGHSSFEISNDQ